MNNSIQLGDTREAILRNLLEGDLSAVELEEKVGINESAIRRHLDVLESRDFVKPYFEKAKRGRPKKRYKITKEGRKVFPQKTQVLFNFIIQKVKEIYGEEGLEDLLEGVSSDFADQLSQGDMSANSEENLEKLVDSLDKFGFYPSLKKDGDSYYIEYKNCVFGGIIGELGPKLCKMHRDIIQNVLEDCSVEQRKSIAEGDNRCLQKISFEESQS